MTRQELKEIAVDKILANFSQPREAFDKEQIKELAESILSNGLINPIIVREWKGKYMIVAGERRWRAHKVAGLKNIQAIVKKYDDDTDWQIESLIENIHREDLSSDEREKFTFQIWKTEKFESIKDLAKRIGLSESTIKSVISAKEQRAGLSLHAKEKLSTRALHDTSGLDKKDREIILKKVIDEEITTPQLREVARVIKTSPLDVKKAFLDNKITIAQAERISKLKPEQRTKAIQEHKNISMVEKGVERNITNQESAKEKREFDKRLLQAGSWISSFRGGVTDSSRSLEKTIKILLISTKFLPIMDEKQKENLGQQLDRFLEILDKAKQLTEQIEEKL